MQCVRKVSWITVRAGPASVCHGGGAFRSEGAGPAVARRWVTCVGSAVISTRHSTDHTQILIADELKGTTRLTRKN